MKRTLFFFFPIALSIALFGANTALAATGSGTCAGDDKLANLFCGGDLAAMLNQAFQISISVGAILAMLRIGYAGYLYMGSADMWSNKTRAKEVFQDAIIGLLLLLAIWLILHQINPHILELEILKSPAATS